MPCRRRRTGRPDARSASTRPRRTYRLLLVEPLEGRHLLSVLTVTVNTAADDVIAGDGLYSLREAILDANAADEPVEIGFEVPAGDSALIISVESPLPTLDNPNHGIAIRGEGLVVLDGSGAGSSAGLQIRSDGNEVSGLEIRNFSEEGILVLGSNNTIRENAIYGNGGLSIDLGGDGPTPNDTLDHDRGANGLQNFPLLSLAETAAGNTTRVVGVLSAAPHQEFVVDFYASSTAAAPAGNSVAERTLGSATVETDAAGLARFDVMIDGPAALGELVVATATDEAGNTSELSRPVVVDEPADQDGPVLLSFEAETVTDASGQPTGIRFALGVSESLYAPPVNGLFPPGAVNNPAYYRLVAMGRGTQDPEAATDVSELITEVRFEPAGPTGGPRIVVEANPDDGLPPDDYELTFFGSKVTDLAGNPFRAGDARMVYHFYTEPPSISFQQGGTRVRAVSPVGEEPPTLLLVEFNDHDLQVPGVENVHNYRFERLAQQGQVAEQLPLTEASYDPLADRVLLSGFPPLQAGRYRLTMFTEPDPAAPGSTGIAGISGLALDGDGDGQPGGRFVEEFSVEPGAAAGELDEGLWQGNFRALSALADEMVYATQDARDALLSDSFLERLAGGIAEVLAARAGDSSDAVARAVNEWVEEFFQAERDAEYQLHDFRPDEYVVVWGNDVRFLLHTPDRPGSEGAVGFDAAGNPVVGVAGANLFDGGTGPHGVSVAVIPAEHAGELLSNHLVVRFDGLPVLPNLTYTLELEGVAATNQAGVIGFGPEEATEAVEWADVPAEMFSHPLDLADVLTGVDLIAEELNRAAVEGVAEVFGSLDDVDTDLLVLWFDPIDYLLADQLGRTSQNVGSQSVNTMAGSFYGSNGFTELLVVPNARADFYTLKLVGLGQGYRGAANFFQGGSLTTAPVQGRLGLMQNLWVQIDFRDGDAGSPYSGLALLSQSGRFEEGRGISSPGVGLAETTILGESSKSRPLILASAGELGIDVTGFDDTGSGGQPTESNASEDDKTSEDSSGEGDEKPDEEKPKSDDEGNAREQGTVGAKPDEDGEEPGESGPERREVLKATDSSEGAGGQGDGTPTSQQGGAGQRSGEGSGQGPSKGGTPTTGAPARAASSPAGRAESLAASEHGRGRGEGHGVKMAVAERFADRFSAPTQDELCGAAVRRVMADPDLSWGESSAGLVAAGVLVSGVRSRRRLACGRRAAVGQASRLPPR